MAVDQPPRASCVPGNAIDHCRSSIVIIDDRASDRDTWTGSSSEIEDETRWLQSVHRNMILRFDKSILFSVSASLFSPGSSRRRKFVTIDSDQIPLQMIC